MSTAERHVPLVGRDALLDELALALGVDPAGSPDGSPEVDTTEGSASLLLGGDAGVGKTRLLLALRDRAQAAGRRVVVGHCLDFGDSALPYLPFSEILGRLQEEQPHVVERVAATYPAIARLLPRQRVRVADVPDGGAPPSASATDTMGEGRSTRADLFAGIHMLLEAAAHEQPLLVVVEDVHWADQSSRELLTYLFTRQVAAPVALVVSYRSDDVHRRHPLRPTLAEWSRLPTLHRAQVGPLGEADVRTLVRALTLHGEPLSDDEVRAIVARAEGNAFFVEELTGMERPGTPGSVPEDLADLLLVRLDRLDDRTREVVGAASVAGRRVSHELLSAVLAASDSGPADLDRSLRQAVDALVLEPGRTGHEAGYSFRHALLSEAVYDDLLPGERTRLHTAYVTALRDGTVPGTAAELAHHARAANDVATAIRASTEAGDEAMRVGAPDEAAAHYQAALELLGPGAAVEVDLVVRAADALSDAGDPYRAAKLVATQLSRLPNDAPNEARARLQLAKVQTAFATEVDFNPLVLTAQVLQLVPPTPPSALRATALMIHAQALRRFGTSSDALHSATEAVDMATGLQLPALVQTSTLVLAKIAELTGDPQAALARLTEVLDEDGLESDVEIPALHQMAMVHYGIGDYARAKTVLLRAAQRARDVRRPWAPWGLDARALAALCAYNLGEWDEALRITDTSHESPPPLAEAYLRSVALDVHAGRGRAGALDEVDATRPFWERDGAILLYCTTAAVDLLGDVGDLDAAVRFHDDAIATLERLWVQMVLWARVRLNAVLVGQLAQHVGRASRAERVHLAEEGERRAAAVRAFLAGESLEGTSRIEARAWALRGEAELLRLRWLADADPPGSDALVTAWRDSVDAFAAMGHVYETARSQTRLAAALHASGDVTQARAVAGRARETARRLGAAPLLGELRTIAGPGRATAAAPPEAAPLTVREREILGLVALGRSNGEIGRALFISTKTVSVHVSNILAKLGAAGRTEAAAIARRQGVLTD